MTYPPGSGPYGNGPQDPWGQPGGYQQQPPGYQQPQPSGWDMPQPMWDAQQQPGWNPQQQGYPGGYPPRPPKNNTGLIVGIIFAVIALLVIGVGAVVVLTRNKTDDINTASPTTENLVTATSSPGRPTTARPTTKPTASASSRFSYQEHAKDWDFKLGDVQMHADWVEGRDHATCSDIELHGKLTGLGCRYAAEMVYRSEGGALMLTQLVLGMSDEGKATAAHDQFTDEDLKFRPGTYIDDFAIGKWREINQKDFLVVTLVTTTSAVDDETASKYLKYLHTDTATALLFR
ncbi:hypothetical protein [Nocardia transvalensis]|uniref:hypothetical protein n=1 Tax=Nocardia transvalensis TaxID=37333 RepID=UPI001894A94C|nr:hypothetical protein [Nocardia transvalensis]MBF6331202.1 hypothetical protein [Nocardia transvalensis]